MTTKITSNNIESASLALLGGPKITAIAVTTSSYTVLDDTAVDTAGGYVKITGTGFETSCQVVVNNIAATSITFISATEVRAQLPATAAGTYIVYLINPTGGVAIRVNGVTFSAIPVWSTNSTLPDGVTGSAISIQLGATSNSATTYALALGSTLPTGISLTTGGLLSGIVTVANLTTYNFTLVATDAELQDTSRAFSITITTADSYFMYTSLLLSANGNNNATNNTFIDSSTNALAITRTGNTTQGTFSPYGANWSNYFSSANYISAASNAAFGFGTGDFTVEAWVYPNAAYTTYNYIWATGVTTGLVFYVLGGVLYVRTYNGSDLLASSTAPAINTWTHVAATRSGTTLRIFVNGVQTGTTTNSTNFATGSGIVGNDGTNAAPWLGYISNLRVVKGTAVYTANFTPSTTPLTAIANTSLLTCQSNSLVDNSANAFTITKTGDTSVQRFSPFSPQTQTAITHSAYFDGSGDYLTVPSNAAFVMGTGDFTVECWINTSVVDAQNDVIIELRSSGATSTGFVFNMNPTGVGYQLNFYTDGAFNLGSTVLNYNVWNHCAVTRSGTTVRLFSNGAVSATFTKANNFSDTPVPHIGVSPLYSPSDTIGYISNLRVVKGTAVYTAAFTPPTTPLTAIANTSLLTCQSPTFVDNSTNNFALTVTGETKPRTVNPFGFTNATAAYSAATYGASAYFDGNADYLYTPQNAAFNFGTGDFTVEGWYYLTAIVTDQSLLMLGTGANGNGPIYCGWWLKYSASGALIFYRYDGTETTYSFSTTLVVNTWYHIACSRSGTSLRMFLNGTQVGATATSSLSFNNANSDPLQIGKCITGLGTFYYNGYISNARIVKGTAVYTSAFTPPTAPVTAIANTSLLCNFTNAGIYDATMLNNLETVGDAKISTTQSKFGGGSMYFDGTGDYCFLPTGHSFLFSKGDFTIESWVYISDTSSRKYILGPGTDTASHYKGFGFEIWGQQLSMWASSNGTSWDILECDTAGNRGATLLAINTWYHVAVSRSGSTFRSFVNGVVEKTFTSSATIFTDATIPYNIGRSGYSPGGYFYYTGYMDDLRVTRGYARYTANFTPPAAALLAQ